MARREALLEMDPAAFREAGHALAKRGIPADVLLEEASRLLFDHSLFNGHPRFWGCITSSAARIGRDLDATMRPPGLPAAVRA